MLARHLNTMIIISQCGAKTEADTIQLQRRSYRCLVLPVGVSQCHNVVMHLATRGADRGHALCVSTVDVNSLCS
jgi:hypothetical protein